MTRTNEAIRAPCIQGQSPRYAKIVVSLIGLLYAVAAEVPACCLTFPPAQGRGAGAGSDRWQGPAMNQSAQLAIVGGCKSRM